MTIEYWIAIAILVLSLIALIIGAGIAFKRINHTLNNVRNVQSEVQREVSRYTSEADLINKRIKQLNDRVNALTEEAQQKAERFTDLSMEANDLSNTLTVLNDNKNELAKNVVQASGKQVKKQGTKLLKLIGLTLKKTVKKQKARYLG